ncbi:sulfopyruvate decarboxylase subunit beta [Methanobrevibacter sp. OttesenSCG-928-K11]|nr:sulfopyruvate decarboxylase subunit beta [Methanobrevibacter sp. OttesenSCG-928-K11]MDL2270927.1 sulfopyruvate decarboxylase subunit beta [Methanobrevibacter sp. OttesenSCG-928-I08]
MKRYDAIKEIMKSVTDELIVCNIGFPSRELYDICDRSENFYMIGSMGLVSSIGLGLALSQNKKVIVIDGDGSLLMNLGSIVTVVNQNPQNLTWVLLNNASYGSTGNQDTYAQDTDLLKIAKSAGLNSYDFNEIDLKEVLTSNELSFINFPIEKGNNESAGIIPLSPEEIKKRFMDICL